MCVSLVTVMGIHVEELHRICFANCKSQHLELGNKVCSIFDLKKAFDGVPHCLSLHMILEEIAMDPCHILCNGFAATLAIRIGVYSWCR